MDLDALKGVKTVNELAGQYQVHQTQRRTVKYEDIYLHDYRNRVDLEQELTTYF